MSFGNNSELIETTYSAKRGHTNCLLKFYNRYPQLRTVYEASNTVLLYPGPDAQDIQDVVQENGPGKYNIILLDGTWAQARGIFLQNLCLQKLKKVMIVQLLLLVCQQYFIFIFLCVQDLINPFQYCCVVGEFGEYGRERVCYPHTADRRKPFDARVSCSGTVTFGE